MGHYFETGFSVREPMWHGLGQVKDTNPESVDELMDWAFEGNPWEPVYSGVLITNESHRCESKDGCRNPSTYRVQMANDGSYRFACAIHASTARKKGLLTQALDTQTLEGWQAIMRDDNSHVLHISQTSFEVFGNREAAELLVRVLDPDFEGTKEFKVKFVTGLVLKQGGVVVYTAYLDHEYYVPGDNSPIYPFCPIINHHDGTGALKIVKSTIRPVCWNTTSAAEAEGDSSGHSYSFRHSKNIRDNIEQAREALSGVTSKTEQWVKYATELVAIPLEDKQFEAFLIDFVPPPPKATDRVMRNVEAARDAIRSFYHSPTVTTVAGTVYGAVQAAVEYLDHGRTFRTKETYVSRSMLSAEKGKGQAIALLEDIVGVEHEDLMAKISK